MTLVCGIHLGEVVVIAADQPLAAKPPSIEPGRSVGAYHFGAIAGTGSDRYLAGFSHYLDERHTGIETLENVVGHLQEYQRATRDRFSPQEQTSTGWFFGALHAFDGTNYTPALGIYHPALDPGPAAALQQGAMELMGLEDLDADERKEFIEKWQGIYRGAFETGGLGQIKGFLALLFEDAAIVSKATSPDFDVAITNGRFTDYL